MIIKISFYAWVSGLKNNLRENIVKKKVKERSESKGKKEM